MSLWEDNKDELDYLGRYKDSADFSSFPTGLQLDSVKEALGVESPLGNAAGSIVCGSPFEVANDPSTGDTGLAMTIDFDDGEDFFDYLMQKDNLWLNVIQNAGDQLRQRIAWALSQIFAISQDAVLERQHTESYAVSFLFIYSFMSFLLTLHLYFINIPTILSLFTLVLLRHLRKTCIW